MTKSYQNNQWPSRAHPSHPRLPAGHPIPGLPRRCFPRRAGAAARRPGAGPRGSRGQGAGIRERLGGLVFHGDVVDA